MQIVCMFLLETTKQAQEVEVIFGSGDDVILHRPVGESLEVLGALLNNLAKKKELNPLTILTLDLGEEGESHE